MLAGGGSERQIGKRPNLTTSKNAERQKVLPPSASECHSLPKWRSSPSRITHNCVFPPEKGACRVKATWNPTQRELRTEPQEGARRWR